MGPKDNKLMEQSIIEAAENLFLEKGSASTSTTEIAKKAGCNQTLVHYYFRTKENLFQAIFIRKVMTFLSAFELIGKKDLPFREKLKEVIEAHFDVISANPRLPFFILNELTTKPERVVMIKEQFASKISPVFNHFDQEMKQAISNGEIRDMDTLELFLTIASLNVSVFLFNPILNEVLDLQNNKVTEFVQKRRDLNVEFVLNSLKPE
jgi:AcrR family transcriptional regulator